MSESLISKSTSSAKLPIKVTRLVSDLLNSIANLPNNVLLKLLNALSLPPNLAFEPFTSRYLPSQSKSPAPEAIFTSLNKRANAISPLPTPLPPSVPKKLNNCNIIEVNPYSHDKDLAAISHAPHVISFALSRKINNLGYIKAFPWINSNGSLSDMTRIANSDPEAWANILKNNQNNLVDFIDEYLEELNNLKTIIKSDDIVELVSYLKKSKPVK